MSRGLQTLILLEYLDQGWQTRVTFDPVLLLKSWRLDIFQDFMIVKEARILIVCMVLSQIAAISL